MNELHGKGTNNSPSCGMHWLHCSAKFAGGNIEVACIGGGRRDAHASASNSQHASTLATRSTLAHWHTGMAH